MGQDALKGFIDKYDELIGVMERIEKNNTLGSFFDSVEQAPLLEAIEGFYGDITPSEETGFKEIHETCLVRIAENMQRVEAMLKKTKTLLGYVNGLYKDYKSREKDIKNEDILRFIKDYEEYHKNDKEAQ